MTYFVPATAQAEDLAQRHLSRVSPWRQAGHTRRAAGVDGDGFGADRLAKEAALGLTAANRCFLLSVASPCRAVCGQRPTISAVASSLQPPPLSGVLPLPRSRTAVIVTTATARAKTPRRNALILAADGSVASRSGLASGSTPTVSGHSPNPRTTQRAAKVSLVRRVETPPTDLARRPGSPRTSPGHHVGWSSKAAHYRTPFPVLGPFARTVRKSLDQPARY